MPLLASARVDIADFLGTLIYVYTVILFVYIIIQLLFSAGVRPPYSRTFDVLFGFLRDVSEPFLGIFRRFVPPLGGIDLSPILAFVTLLLVRSIVVEGLIRG
jgi:uncharacterized protein YggT (Ycf19 family)